MDPDMTVEQIRSMLSDLLEKIGNQLILDKKRLERLNKQREKSKFLARWIIGKDIKKVEWSLFALEYNQGRFSRAIDNLDKGNLEKAMSLLEWMVANRQWGYRGSDEIMTDAMHERARDSLTLIMAKAQPAQNDAHNDGSVVTI